MRKVLTILALVALIPVLAFLDYVRPKTDVVYVTNAYNRLVEPGELRGVRALNESTTTTTGQARLGADVFFIDAVRRDGEVRVYRNEDTGFGLPLYFKFDSASLNGEAQNAISTQGDPRWHAVRYYGWRIPYLSLFPNAIKMWPVADPNARIIPWVSIGVGMFLILLAWFIIARIRRLFRQREAVAAAGWETPTVRKGWFR